MENWVEIRAWRRLTRIELRSKRSALPSREKESVRTAVCDLVRESFPEVRDACIGFYWPFQGEVDLRGLCRNFIALGAEAALPVVVEKQQPMEFWSWQPQMKLVRGIWNIPIPSERNPVQPTVLLVPLLGFDGSGYRLGQGGGYYDCTLATVAQKPLTIGIGYELGGLETIYPQPHDIPMDAIVTESRVARFRDRDDPANTGKGAGETAPQPRGSDA
jgi:5-formyltetrahydrofolate cyclo-ligase